MIIEIRKAGFINKGAELMLRAILVKLRAAYPEALITIAPTRPGKAVPFRKLVEAGLYPKADLYHRGVQWGLLARYVPAAIRQMYGVVLDREVDVVIDAAGFAYSDQWGEAQTLELARSAKRWHRQGTKVILMPQAFGPFKDKRIRKAMLQVADNVALIMPRERTSFEYLTELTGVRPNIIQYPDFTNLLEGVVPEYFDSHIHRVCLVPNCRMLDMTSSQDSAAYLPFMVRCAEYLLEKGERPFLLVHEGKNDESLAEQISSSVGEIPILREDDALKIKGILGVSYATIGSRFHGLVSALSQGVPSLATGWSHKYAELFSDYGFPEGVVAVTASESALIASLDRILDKASHQELRTTLLAEADKLRALSEDAWERVFAVIDRHDCSEYNSTESRSRESFR